MNFDYFYGEQSEQYAFYRTPKVFYTDERFRGLSSDAKTVYGILLDRVSLSAKNGWADEEGRVYVYMTVRATDREMGRCERTSSQRVSHERSDNGCCQGIISSN